MIKPIVKDIIFLGQKSEISTKDDMQVVQDLKDTLSAHRDGCVGMAANMIGYRKRTIIVSLGIVDLVMINPVIISKNGEYETEEGCLSLQGKRKTKRYKDIEVKFMDTGFKEQKQKFSGYVAQIIQHECDHLDGIII
ncbi:MAG: peptide deformylase [Lachnospiraceae bacterium]|nr:peptide deformylase [Lachnospiraceae bacterium]